MDISHPTVNVFGFCWECHNNNNHRRHANEVGLFVLCKSTEIGGNREHFCSKIKGFFAKIVIKLPKIGQFLNRKTSWFPKIVNFLEF